VIVAALLPNVTPVTLAKFVPVIFTSVPTAGPEVGLILVIVGTEYNVITNPVPATQAKTGVFPHAFVPSVGNVVGRVPVSEMSVYVPAGIVSRRFTVIPEGAVSGPDTEAPERPAPSLVTSSADDVPLNARDPVIVRVPALPEPVPPRSLDNGVLATVTAPGMVPAPERVPPDTVFALVPVFTPLTRSSPALTVVVPV
jgi:hypothetical protein